MKKHSETKEKKSVFSSFFGFFKGRSKKRRDIESVYSSKFAIHMDGLTKGSPEFSRAVSAALLCDESMGVVLSRIRLLREQKDVMGKLAEVECYNSLTEAEAEKLKDLLSRFMALSRDKNILKYQVTGFDKSIIHIAKIENEAQMAIDEIVEAENKQRIFKQDISYLEGEKLELEDEYQMLKKSVDIMKKLTVGLVVFSAIVAAILLFFGIFEGTDVVIPIGIIALTVIVIDTLMYVFSKKMKRTMRLNIKKQNKAVEILNTKNTVYAYYTKFLEYEYKKYQVRNSKMLKSNLKDYSNYKHLTKRFDSIRSIMYQTEEEIERILRKNNIKDFNSSLENFANTINIDDKKQYYNDLAAQRDKIETDLHNIDDLQEQIWDELTELLESDAGTGGVVENIINDYMDQAGVIMSRHINEEKIIEKLEAMGIDTSISVS